MNSNELVDFTFEDESNQRNYVLFSCHQNIPADCLWTSNSIELETKKERLNWWKNVTNNKFKNETTL